MTGFALIVGRDRPFAHDVAVRLRADGATVVDAVAALPDGAALDMLVADLSRAAEPVRFRSVGEDDLRRLLDDQLYTFVEAVQASAPRMMRGGGIVAIVSNAYLGSWGGVHVAASAAACVAMARSMAIELAPRGIRVNCVATGSPGEAWDTPAARADIAATAAWLAGPQSGQVTGETILADRGASLRMAQAARR